MGGFTRRNDVFLDFQKYRVEAYQPMAGWEPAFGG
jgi:hypothetical protein